MTYKQKAKTLRECFDIYGYGNFDLTLEEIAQVLEILDQPRPKIKLRRLYVQLKNTRLG